MHLFFWKNGKKDEKILIKKSCYDKLPKKHQLQFIEHDILEDEPTHHVMDVNGNFELYNTMGLGSIPLETFVTVEILKTMEQQSDSVIDQPIQSPEFGGGSGGGGGAGGDWSNDQQTSQPDIQQSYDQPSSSSDNNSSYDSSSSNDSSSNYDSGASSSGGGDGY